VWGRWDANQAGGSGIHFTIAIKEHWQSQWHTSNSSLNPKASLEAGGPVMGVPGSAGGVGAETALAGSVWHGWALSKLAGVGVGRLFPEGGVLLSLSYVSDRAFVLLHLAHQVVTTPNKNSRRKPKATPSWN